PGDALEGALTLARRIATLDRAAVSAAKAMLQAGLNLPYEAALGRERDLFPALWTGETHQAAMRAFIERQNGS
ncbi:MAG: enoyl-CoA hydratase, partial [Anaerolineae bacterium]|nr:enoyl-CoA hydratase [Anaerolineae bacterium]